MQLMTVGQAAAKLSRSPSLVRWLVDTGRLKAVRAGSYRLIPAAEIERVLKERVVSGKCAPMGG